VEEGREATKLSAAGGGHRWLRTARIASSDPSKSWFSECGITLEEVLHAQVRSCNVPDRKTTTGRYSEFWAKYCRIITSRGMEVSLLQKLASVYPPSRATTLASVSKRHSRTRTSNVASLHSALPCQAAPTSTGAGGQCSKNPDVDGGNQRTAAPMNCLRAVSPTRSNSGARPDLQRTPAGRRAALHPANSDAWGIYLQASAPYFAADAEVWH
jgi:hypothetical protein